MSDSYINKAITILIDFVEILLIAVSVFIVVYLFVGQLLEVTGDSMFPTFKDKEQIIAEKVSLEFKPVERGEIIILRSPVEPERLLIKRVIGLPGEKIMIKSGQVYINDTALKEPYLINGVKTQGGETIEGGNEYQIADDSYVFLGDNREKSTDSREYGAVKKEFLIGRGLFVYYPFSNMRLVKND